MDLSTMINALIAISLVIAPLAALAAFAGRFGVDSRPDAYDRDPRPWLMSTD